MNRRSEMVMEKIARGEILISDGAMGTLLHAQGLGGHECPESWCATRPEVVRGIAQAYFDAGANMVETNSFGGNSFRLASYGMADRVEEFNRAAAALAREAAGEDRFVAASVGPTAQFLKGEGGKIEPEAFYESFAAQVKALAEGGADVLCVETMSSINEARQAIRAAKEFTSLPVFCTFTFEAKPRGFFTMMGVTPEKAAAALVEMGADAIGANCGNGITNMIEITRRMRAAAPSAPILIHANAGMPTIEEGKTIFKETPEFMAAQVGELIGAGANIIGGCCGTTPAHIAAMAQAARLR